MKLVHTTTDKLSCHVLTDLKPGTKIFIEEPKTYNLELTEMEAATLRSLLQFIGGNPESSPRKHVGMISEKLTNLDVGWHPNHSQFISEEFGGRSIYLASETEL